MGDGELIERLKKALPPNVEHIKTLDAERKGATAKYALHLGWHHSESSATFFTTGYFETLELVVDFTARIFENMTERQIMKLLKSAALFPNIKGIMLKDEDMILTLSGGVKEIAPDAKGGRTRLELSFSDSPKTAIINANQLMKIINLYGDDTDHWNGKRVALYGEFGTWFGKSTWAIRVRDKAPAPVKRFDPRKAAINRGADFIEAAVEGLGFFDASEVKKSLKALGKTSIPGTPAERKKLWDDLKALQEIKIDQAERYGEEE